jgi:hypothetical protein
LPSWIETLQRRMERSECYLEKSKLQRIIDCEIYNRDKDSKKDINVKKHVAIAIRKEKAKPKKKQAKRKPSPHRDPGYRPLPTNQEQTLRILLEQRGFSVIPQFFVPYVGGYRFVDLFHPDSGVGIEVYGNVHRGQKARKKDAYRSHRILSTGLVKSIFVIWNSDCHSRSKRFHELLATLS